MPRVGPTGRSLYPTHGPSRDMRAAPHPQARSGALNRPGQKRSLWDPVAPSIP